MRKLRKLTAAVLAVALVLTSMTAVFAADTATLANADKAVTLKDLGLYSGQDANDPKVGLEDALTTQDSLIFLAKLFGYNDAANALTADQVAESLAKFDDAASISDYAKNVVAYSATSSILSGSTKDGKFFVGAKDTVTAARFATFMLKQMGYTVADYKVSVAKLAETKGSKVDATLSGDLTRDAAVGVMYGALTAEKASGKTVIADIVGDNADLKAKAEKLGLLQAQPVTDPTDLIDGGNSSGSGLSGSGSDGGGSSGSGKGGSGSGGGASSPVRAINNKQIVISFNAEMDINSAQDQANYIIKDKGEVVKTLTSTSCKLSDDKKTVTITLDSTVQDCLTNSSKAKVILSKDIMSAKGNKLDVDKEYDVEVQDELLPTVTKIEATGESNIRITFSEPVYEGGNNSKTLTNTNFAVKSGTYTYYVKNAELNLNVINLEIGTKLIEGPITVTVNDAGLYGINVIQDYAGYKVFKGSTTFNYVRDTSVPVVTVRSAKADEVVLAFSKPVKGKNIKLYHSAKNAENYKTEATTTGYVDEITFTFGMDRLLPSGNINLYLVNSDTESEKIVDSFSIKVPDQTLTCVVVNDATAPVVESCKENTNESIKITFNEKLDEEVATNPDSYVVKSLSDNMKMSFEVILADSREYVELVFSTKLVDNTTYKLIIKNYQDLCGNKNSSDYEYEFTTGDNTPPTVLDQDCFSIAEKGAIYIIYSEAMNESQMLDMNNYMVSIDGDLTTYNSLDLYNDKVSKVSDKMVKIYVKEIEDMNNPTITPYVKIAPIMDLANKRLYNKVDPYIVSSIGRENVCIEEAQLIAKNKIKVIFNKRMESVSKTDIELTTSTTTPGSISVSNCESTTPSSINISSIESNVVNDAGKTEVVLILDKDLSTDAKDAAGALIGITTVANPISKSEFGTKLRPNFSIALLDNTAPEIVKWDHDSNESTAEIAQVIAGGDLANPQVYNQDYTVPKDTIGTITITFSEDIAYEPLSALSFTVKGFTVTDIAAPAGTKAIILTVKANDNNTSVKTTVTQVYNISDTVGNVLASGSTWSVMFADTSLNSSFITN